MKRDLLGLVLCGGKSRRLGLDKANLRIRGQQTQLQYALSVLEPYCARTALGLGPRDQKSRSLEGGKGVEKVFDKEAVEGPMSAVLAAFEKYRSTGILLLACDMVYVERHHMLQLLHRRDRSKAATAFVATDGQPEPMCAIYEPGSFRALAERAENGRASLRGFLLDETVELVRPENPDFLASVNTPAALQVACSRFGGS